MKVDPAAFYAGLIGYPLRQHGAAGSRHAALLALSQVANAGGFAWAAMTERRD